MNKVKKRLSKRIVRFLEGEFTDRVKRLLDGTLDEYFEKTKMPEDRRKTIIAYHKYLIMKIENIKEENKMEVK